MKCFLTCIALFFLSHLDGVVAAATALEQTSARSGGLRQRTVEADTYRRRLCLLPPGCSGSHSSSSGSGSGESGSGGSNGKDAASQGASRTRSLLVYFLATATVVTLFGAAYKRRRVCTSPSNGMIDLA
jgi:hypothetical protein